MKKYTLDFWKNFHLFGIIRISRRNSFAFGVDIQNNDSFVAEFKVQRIYLFWEFNFIRKNGGCPEVRIYQK